MEGAGVIGGLLYSGEAWVGFVQWEFSNGRNFREHEGSRAGYRNPGKQWEVAA
jgi:hypothetical protein